MYRSREKSYLQVRFVLAGITKLNWSSSYEHMDIWSGDREFVFSWGDWDRCSKGNRVSPPHWKGTGKERNCMRDVLGKVLEVSWINADNPV